MNTTRPAVGHMPFDHRTCAEWMFKPEPIAAPQSRFIPVAPRNAKLIDLDNRLIGRWR